MNIEKINSMVKDLRRIKGELIVMKRAYEREIEDLGFPEYFWPEGWIHYMVENMVEESEAYKAKDKERRDLIEALESELKNAGFSQDVIVAICGVNPIFEYRFEYKPL